MESDGKIAEREFGIVCCLFKTNNQETNGAERETWEMYVVYM